MLTTIEAAGFEVMITADQNLEYQQNLKGRNISLIVLGAGSWPVVRNHLPEIVLAVDAARPNGYFFLAMPLPPKRTFNL